ncbi:STAS domain-containing protein [Mycolicibacterium rufum]|uniref:Anti-sigma factor antagonist n=1 Tax=Mycolicibacterium rufum TaxID=318424 RepID=A0A9X2XYM4_9MYCO|nr:STAS domain-containing protein [Mycolicibacterium rufum]KGI70424.1 anti-sigma factor antagonist [Mycolicibacterium rufum]MCV7071236.1 STAS domain-containing protein [Mycolicibacterium rufum]ULP36750.1 STAS domain-containing protein [Mycolicibacterium rufum]
MNLMLSTDIDGTALTLRVGGDLDYQSTGELIAAVSAALAGPSVTDLHLDFTELTFCDSAGLSGLLLIHRKTSTAGVHLHLDHRPAQLQRILDITGVLDHLTTRPAREQPSESGIV